MVSKKGRGRGAGSEIEKGFALKIIETLDGLQLLRDAVVAVKEGKLYQLPVLSGQMRSLLIDRAGGSERRLFYIAERLNVPLNMYCMRGVDDPDFPISDPDLWVSGFPITGERQLENQRELTFDQILSEPFILYRGVRYSPRTIIEWFANKAGGAHYSGTMPKHFAEMLTLNFEGIDVMRQLLLQLAEATIVVAQKVLRAAIQQELHILIAVPSRPKGVVYLVDAAYPESMMRLSIMLDERATPVVQMTGIDGSYINLMGDRFISWDQMRHLHLSVSIDGFLKTHAELQLDGEIIGVATLPGPLFLSSDWGPYDVFHNKSVDGGAQDFEFALGGVVQVGAKHSPSDRANMLLYEKARCEDPQAKLILYGAESFGRSPPGEMGLKMEGNVKRVTVSDVLLSGYAK